MAFLNNGGLQIKKMALPEIGPTNIPERARLHCTTMSPLFLFCWKRKLEKITSCLLLSATANFFMKIHVCPGQKICVGKQTCSVAIDSTTKLK